jgi:hypothetical protein
VEMLKRRIYSSLPVKNPKENLHPLGPQAATPQTVSSFVPSFKAANRKGHYHGNRPSQEAVGCKHRQSPGLLHPQSRPVGKYYARHTPGTQNKPMSPRRHVGLGPQGSVEVGNRAVWFPCYKGRSSSVSVWHLDILLWREFCYQGTLEQVAHRCHSQRDVIRQNVSTS